MTTALVYDPAGADTSALARELDAAGIHVLGAAARGELVRVVARDAPDVVVCHAPRPDDALFAETRALQSSAPCAVVVFTAEPAGIERAIASGVHAYVVDEGAPRRLRALVQLARSRFAHERALREALRDATDRYADRTWVDRATEASTGQLRMLSQRVVKLCALLVVGAAPTPNRQRLAHSIARIDDTFALLHERLAPSGCAELLATACEHWRVLRALLSDAPTRGRLGDVDARAAALLGAAERLTAALRTRRHAAGPRVIDLSGRQRMLSQRAAGNALLAVVLAGPPAAHADAQAFEARREFESALAALGTLPLRSPAIDAALAEAAAAWRELLEALPRAGTLAGQCAIGEASETVLAVFERLTGQYESSMQLLAG